MASANDGYCSFNIQRYAIDLERSSKFTRYSCSLTAPGHFHLFDSGFLYCSPGRYAYAGNGNRSSATHGKRYHFILRGGRLYSFKWLCRRTTYTNTYVRIHHQRIFSRGYTARASTEPSALSYYLWDVRPILSGLAIKWLYEPAYSGTINI